MSSNISLHFGRPKNYSFLWFMICSRYKNGNIKPFNKILVALKDSYLKVGINNLLARQSLFEPNTFLSWFFVELTSKFVIVGGPNGYYIVRNQIHVS